MNKRILSVLLAVLLLATCIPTAFAATGTLRPNTGTRHEVCTALSAQAEAYYTGEYAFSELSALSGDASDPMASDLFLALNELMTDTMTDSVSYNSLPDYWEDTDAEKGEAGYILFYTDEVSSSCNREHVWPKSRASFYQKNGGADLHHLRPANSGVNSARSNYTMGYVRGVLDSYTNRDNIIYYNGSADLVEVNDNIKGDVARIFLYVYVRWEQPNLYENVASSELPAFDSDDSANNGKKVIESLDTLLRWMETDPVDTWEMSRNDETEHVQGNRNVFIDYPEFAWLLFDETVPDDYVTPSGEGNVSPEFTVTAESADDSMGTVSVNGYTVTAEPKEGYAVLDATVSPEGAATLTVEGNRIRLKNVISDCTVTVRFQKKATATITYRDAVHGDAEETAYVNETYVLPDREDRTVDGTLYRFLGWSERAIAAPETTFPEVQSAGEKPVATGDRTYYAVYRYGEEGESAAEWVQLSDGDTLKPDTEYAFVSIPYGTTTHYLMNNTVVSTNYWGGTAFTDYSGSFENGTVTADSVDEACIFTAEEWVEGGFSLKNNDSGKYLAHSSTQSTSKAYRKFDTGRTEMTATTTLGLWRMTIENNEATVVSDAYPDFALCYAHKYSDWSTYDADNGTAQVYAACYVLQHGGGMSYYYTTSLKEEQEQPDGLLGDVDLDGDVDTADAALLLRGLVSLTTLTKEQTANANYNQDGVVSASDAAGILRRLVGSEG